VHDVFELSDRKAQDKNGPAQLIDLETDVPLLHGGDRCHECGGVEDKGEAGIVLCIIEEIVLGGIGFDDLNNKVAVGMEDG